MSLCRYHLTRINNKSTAAHPKLPHTFHALVTRRTLRRWTTMLRQRSNNSFRTSRPHLTDLSRYFSPPLAIAGLITGSKRNHFDTGDVGSLTHSVISPNIPHHDPWKKINTRTVPGKLTSAGSLPISLFIHHSRNHHKIEEQPPPNPKNYPSPKGMMMRVLRPVRKRISEGGYTCSHSTSETTSAQRAQWQECSNLNTQCMSHSNLQHQSLSYQLNQRSYEQNLIFTANGH